MKQFKLFGRVVKLSASGWPWQLVGNHWANSLDKTAGERWGWNPFKVKGMGRFGGGWAFKFGIVASSSFSDVCVDLAIGSVRITVKGADK